MTSPAESMPWPPRLDDLAEVEFSGGLLSRWSVEEDAAALLQTAKDPLIRRWNPMPVTTLDDARTLIQTRTTSEDSLSWAIRGWPGGVLLGALNLFHFEEPVRAVECGYWIAPAARGRGLAARALLAAADFVFTEWAGNRLLLFHAVPNQASCRVAVKAGMTLEGHLRQSYKYGDGTVYDEHLHAILASDLAR
ncbi:MAG: GNAT family protein [Nocardioides sp.]|jgi:RimJ/RimL family protein N-acetyltransferase